jgi:hypothetical protein
LARLGAAKIIAIVATLGAVSAVSVGIHLRQRAPSADEVRRLASRPPAPPRTVVEPTALPPAAESPPPAPAAEHAVPPRATRGDARPTLSAALAAEISAIDAARSALAASDGTRALSLLDAYGREHPRGRLQLEAEVLRIDALSKSGKTAQAKDHARLFLQRHPNSVLASRVRATLER